MAVTRKKRRRSPHPENLLVDAAVEIKSFEDGLLGSWHPAKIIDCESKQYLVQYYHLFSDDDQTENLSEYVVVSSSTDNIGSCLESPSNSRGRIRPTPPKVDLSTRLQYSMCVDAYYNDAWWEGVVFDHQDASGEWKIFFPDQGDELSISTDNLRLTQDWNEATGDWSVRGIWLFMEIIEDLQPNYVIPVSVKQMWYDLRENERFNQIMEWTFQGKDVWKELILEVINENLEITAEEFLSTINLSRDLVVYDESIRNSDSNFAEVDAVVAAENFDSLNSTALMASEAGRDCGSNLHSRKESLYPLSSTKLVGKPSRSSRVAKPWRPLEISPVLRAEDCPSSVAEYLNSKKNDFESTTKVRKHLLFLGWEIDCYMGSGIKRVRYTSPDGKSYYSLVKLCKDLMGSVPNKASCDVKEIKENASSSLSSDCLNTPCLEIVPRKSSSHVVKKINENASPSLSSDCLNTSAEESAEFVESRYCPEAITEYLKSWDLCLRTKIKKKQRVLAENARQHLAAIGWKFWSKDKKGRVEARFTSPEQKNYYSLRTACQAIQGVVHSSNPLQAFSEEAHSGDKPLLTNPDVRICMVSLFQQSEESIQQKSRNSVDWKTLKRKKSDLLRDRHPTSSSQRQSKVNDTQYGSTKKRKVTSDLRNTVGSADVNKSAQVLRSCKIVRQVTAPSTMPHNPRTVISWLIDKNIVLPRAKVFYRGKDKNVMAEGRVTRDGIKCGCCQNVLTLSDFESHARSSYRQPAANIFLEDGRSLIDCQMQLLRNSMERFRKDTVGRKRRNESHSASDHICSVCHYGGELILCDRCPSSFHANCLTLQAVPDGDWFCPSCCCAKCGRSDPVDNTVCLNERSKLSCDQCERLFHVSCLGGRGGLNLDSGPKRKWFCHRTCAEVYKSLQKLQRKTIPLDHDNLTWTLIKPMQYEDGDGLDETHVNMMAENHSKLSLALEVMHECFEPVKEPRTGRDLVEDVIFGRGSDLKRLNFTGFYTILLQKNDELVSAATLRIYGNKVAELPLVGTRFHYRRLGMCRILMNELEKMLAELGIERLVLPAVPNVLNTWTGAFEFSKMTPSERSEFLGYTFLDFQGTMMCHKFLKKPDMTPSRLPAGCHHEVREIVVRCESSIEFDCRSAISQVYHGAQVEGSSNSVDQGSLDIPKENDSSGGKDQSSDAMLVPPSSDQQCSATENKSDSTKSQDHPILDISARKFQGEIKQYRRKKPVSIRPVQGTTNYPNVEVSCR